ncbi:hypothetical protein G6F59_015897 [Rhizopus arrhizus]|nr:hypothetical protein G6F59_015897 [Rhizopus arrhizus]
MADTGTCSSGASSSWSSSAAIWMKCRAASRLHRTGIDGGGAQPLQQLRGQVPALRRLPHVMTEWMAVVAVGGDRGQRAALFAEIQPRIVHLRQHRLAARHAVQERCLHRCRPAGQPQQADAPHGLDQARIERCMVGHVTVQRRGRFHARTIALCPCFGTGGGSGRCQP